ncbi:toll-like receptor 4 [Haliotis rufescens]|uniref:toll-like receptor 4 n=1 Tax=Haliotis rufescens TaxID=6454 RepID=UPI00201F9E0F|nr:toll-like receptor 4 [Haliotis rufescens]
MAILHVASIICVIPFVLSLSSDATPICSPCKCGEIQGQLIANCSGLELRKVPKHLPPEIRSLDLGCNKIYSLNGRLNLYQYLRHLNISNNKLIRFQITDFSKLYHLEILDVHCNRLNLDEHVYPIHLFRAQRKLQQLFVHKNSAIHGANLSYPDKTFSDLISLQTLHIDGLFNPMFGKGFGNMKHLSLLSLEGNCDMRHIQNETFQYLPNITFLSMTNCYVLQIEADAFSPLQNIHTLDISKNSALGLTNAGKGLYGLRHSSLKVYKACQLHWHHGQTVFVRYQDLMYLQNTSLEELYLDDNRIELFDNILLTYLPKTLRILSVKHNTFFFGIYLLEMSVLSIEWADISQQHSSYIETFGDASQRLERVKRIAYSKKQYMSSLEHRGTDEDNFYYHGHDSRSSHKKLYIPPNLTFLNFSISKLAFTIPQLELGPNSLKTIDLSNNFLTRWEGPLSGLDSLEYFDLSHNHCEYIANDFLLNLSSISVFNASHNNLGLGLGNSSLSQFHNLKHLILSHNQIANLPSEIFKNLTSLQYLDLSSNSLKTWDANIYRMSNLMIIDLSRNAFVDIPKFLRSQLDKLSPLKVKLFLHGNSLQCDCQTLLSLKWMESKETKVVELFNLTCTSIDNREMNMTNLRDIVLNLEKRCASFVGLTIGLLSVVVLALALALFGLMYRYRWKLRYAFYSIWNKHQGYLSVNNKEQEFEFDAFVSYADEDRTFVVTDMRQILEEQERPEDNFILCIHHRDFLPGEAIAANILKAISSSRKTVVILTRNFLKSYWCRYEMEMAKMESIYTGRNTLHVVVMEDIPVKDLPVDIVEVMRRDSYVEFTDDMEGNAQLKKGS